MRINLTKRDVIWSYVGTAMSMGANLLMLPIIIYYLDSDMLGLWYVFASIGGIATLFDFGFGVTFARNITYCWSGSSKLKKEDVSFVKSDTPNFFLMKLVLCACKKVYFRISISALVLLLTFGLSYIDYIGRNIDNKDYILGWIIYSVAVFLNLYYGYYTSFLRGVGAISEANINVVIARLTQILATLLLLSLGCGIVGACIGYLCYGTIFRLLGKWKFYSYDNIRDKLNRVDKKINNSDLNPLIEVVWHNAWREGIITISNYLNNQSTVIISSLYLSLSETGSYSIGIQMASAIATISSTLLLASQPQLQEAYVNKDKEKVICTMALIVMSLFYIFVFCTITVTLFVIPIIKMIKPSTIISIPIFLGLCLYHLVLKYRDCYCCYFSSTNRIVYMNAFVFSSFICILLSFLFLGIFHFGVWGLIFAQLISQIVYNVWYWPMRAHEEIRIGLIPLCIKGSVQMNVKICDTLRTISAIFRSVKV